MTKLILDVDQVCASCGSDDRLHRDILHGLWLCIECDALDLWFGYPVLKNEPDECPFCGGWVETGLLPDEDITDDDLIHYFGEDDPRINYIHDCAQCENTECPSDRSYFGYGRGWYWNPDDEDYTAAKPLVGPAEHRAYNQKQEAAGQKRLPGLDA